MRLSWSKYRLKFYRPAGTSRGVMNFRDVWFIFAGDKIGECAPLPGLSIDNLNLIESKLDEVCSEPERFLNNISLLDDFPSIKCGLEMLQMGVSVGFAPIAINGLVWMGAPDFMSQQVEKKLRGRWNCIKIKVGAIDWGSELEVLSLAARGSVELRVDANGAFVKKDVMDRLARLSEFGLHSIEQPIRVGQWELLAELCASNLVPIALDEELIPLRRLEDKIAMLDKVRPHYLVLKPSLLGGFTVTEEWIALAEERGIGWWITSALESNIGLESIASWAAGFNLSGYQGLGTGLLFSNNIPSPLFVRDSMLMIDRSTAWTDVRKFIIEWLEPSEVMELHTSGSTGRPKKIVVKKEWMRNSAKLTGETFGLSGGDSALLCLPMEYIAAKMMVVRAFELGLKLVAVSPTREVDKVADFVAMVPLQLENSLDCLDKAKVLLVGGSYVSKSLTAKLQGVKAKVFETYGMTETLTHVAVKPLNGDDKSDYFSALNGIRFEVDDRGCLVVFAPELNCKEVVTNDIVELIDENNFKWLGRYDNVINSGGVKLYPEIIERKLEEFIFDRRYFVVGMPDNELGEKVVLFIEGAPMDIALGSVFDNNNYEKPKCIIFRDKFIEVVGGKVDRLATVNSVLEEVFTKLSADII